MNSGLFFELSADTDLTSGLCTFMYKPIRQGHHHPIYCVSGANELAFYYSDIHSYENSRILTLNYADSILFDAELNAQLNLIAQPEFTHQLLPLELNGNEPAINIPLSHTIYHYSHPNLNCFRDARKGHRKREEDESKYEIKEICLVTLLLDFLFDFHHSEVFQHSPAYYRIRTVLRENHLLKAICAKAEYCYQIHFQSTIERRKEGMRFYAEGATHSWLEILMDDLSPEILAPSPWFEENLEDEVPKVMKDAGSLISERVQTKLIEWYLSRFNYENAIETSSGNRSYAPFILTAGYGVLTIALFIEEKTSWGICLIMLLASVFIWMLVLNLFGKWPEIRKMIAKMAFLSMPRLQISLFLAWVVYAGTALNIPQIKWGWIILYWFVSVSLVAIYLSKEIKLRAPDVPVRKMGKRIFLLISWAFGVSALMGALILTIAFDAFGRKAVEDTDIIFTKFFDYEIALLAWLSATIFVFFFGLFVNLLFAGKKFTGF